MHLGDFMLQVINPGVDAGCPPDSDTSLNSKRKDAAYQFDIDSFHLAFTARNILPALATRKFAAPPWAAVLAVTLTGFLRLSLNKSQPIQAFRFSHQSLQRDLKVANEPEGCISLIVREWRSRWGEVTGVPCDSFGDTEVVDVALHLQARWIKSLRSNYGP